MLDIQNLISSVVPAFDRSRYASYIDQAANAVTAAVTEAAQSVVEKAQDEYAYGSQAADLLREAGLLPEPQPEPEPEPEVSAEETAAAERLAAAIEAATAAQSASTEALKAATEALAAARR